MAKRELFDSTRLLRILVIYSGITTVTLILLLATVAPGSIPESEFFRSQSSMPPASKNLEGKIPRETCKLTALEKASRHYDQHSSDISSSANSDSNLEQEMLADQLIDIELYQFERVKKLTPEQRSLLRAAMKRHNRENFNSPTGEDEEAVIEANRREISEIVGADIYDAVAQLQVEDAEREALQDAEGQAAYISEAIGLSESSYELLVNTLSAATRFSESRISYRKRRLNLNEEQISKMRELWKYEDDYEKLLNFVEEQGGRSGIGQGYYDNASTDNTPNLPKVFLLLVRKEMKPLLSPAQYAELQKIDGVSDEQ